MFHELMLKCYHYNPLLRQKSVLLSATINDANYNTMLYTYDELSTQILTFSGSIMGNGLVLKIIISSGIVILNTIWKEFFSHEIYSPFEKAISFTNWKEEKLPVCVRNTHIKLNLNQYLCHWIPYCWFQILQEYSNDDYKWD